MFLSLYSLHRLRWKQGCGGVCCIDGVTMCCDGTSLSDTCKAKGCDVSDDDDVGCFIITVTYGPYDDNGSIFLATEE